MNEYQKMVRQEGKDFFEKVNADFQKDKEEFGGQADSPNLPKWLDRTKKLFDHLDGIKKDWNRTDAELVNQNSRNSVPYGDPKESAYFAYYKDLLRELKRLQKTRTRT